MVSVRGKTAYSEIISPQKSMLTQIQGNPTSQPSKQVFFSDGSPSEKNICFEG